MNKDADMKCKKCGYELEKEWQACPICSETIKKRNNVFLIIGIIAGVVILSGAIDNFNST